MKIKYLLICLFSFLCLNLSTSQASLLEECSLQGKLDIGPTFLSVDVLESGKTIETLDMKGAKGDLTLLVWRGVCLKTGFLVGEGHGKLRSGYVGIGHYFPINERLLLIPSFGVTFTYLRTKVDLEPFGLYDLKERFHSTSPYIGLDVCYQLTDKWTLMGMIQYAWCRTHTTIEDLFSDKSKSVGPNYSLGVEYSFNKNWSLNLGVGYNESLSKEKHGIRGKGAKLGLAYYF